MLLNNGGYYGAIYIIYGFGRIGKNVLQFLESQNKKVVCIIDRNAENKKDICHIPIVTIDEVDAKVLADSVVIVSIANESDNHIIYADLEKRGCKRIYKYSDGLEAFCENECCHENCLKCVWVETCHKFERYCTDGILTINNNKILDSLSIGVTNRCTLNCKCCTAGIQQIRCSNIKIPDLTYDLLKQYMEVLFDKIDYVYQLTLTGGESLLCNDLPRIIEFLCHHNKIGYVKLLTTGSVKLSNDLIRVFKENNILICIDDYGKNLSDKIRSIVEENKAMLDLNGIFYTCIDNEFGTWYDLGGFEYRDNKAHAYNCNKTCYFRKCLFLSPNGILSWCNRNVNGINYGWIPDFKNEYCDLKSPDCNNIMEVLSLDYLHACEYCNGSCKNNIIKPGVQL